MNHHERIAAALAGEEFDRIPYAFWSHFPDFDLDPNALATKTVDFYRAYDIDFVKTMPNGMYAVEDFGCRCDFSQICKGGVATIEETPVNCDDDWSAIEPLTTSAKALKREITSFEMIRDAIGDEVPILFTVFSPLTIASKISKGKVVETIRQGKRDLLEFALEAISETVSRLCEEVVDRGAAGVFFATQMATNSVLTVEEYERYGKKYDLKALEGANKGWMNTIHLHGTDVMFDTIADYPVQLLNWHVWETEPTIAEAKNRTDLALMGGINRHSITANNRDEIKAQIEASVEQSQGKRHLLSPGCVIRYPLMDQALRFVEEVRNNVWEGGLATERR